MIRFLLGAAVGILLITNPEVRQITADMLRAAGDALAPAAEDKTLQKRIKNLLGGN